MKLKKPVDTESILSSQSGASPCQAQDLLLLSALVGGGGLIDDITGDR